MSHFSAYYRCFECEEIVGGTFSNSMLVVPTVHSHTIAIILLRIKLVSKLEIACERHAESYFIPIQFNCCNCEIPVKFFYFPSFTTILDEGIEIIVPTEHLLAEQPYKLRGYCSYECECKKRRSIQGENIEIPPPKILFDKNP